MATVPFHLDSLSAVISSADVYLSATRPLSSIQPVAVYSHNAVFFFESLGQASGFRQRIGIDWVYL
jgi:hypothetical protein